MFRLLACSLYLLSLLPIYAQATAVEERMTNGFYASADYIEGDANKPAILLLHGFLTVHTINLIQNITTELAGNQYTVLAPTLTLGINKRRTSLECNALHLHDMDADLKEIDWWVNWLIAKGHNNIILIGHSSGAVQLTNYASSQKHPEVTRLIELSLVPLGNLNREQFQASMKLAHKMIADKNVAMTNFTLAYCIETYTSPPKNFMSYATWDSTKILKTLKALNINRHVIMGSNDIPVNDTWIPDLRKTGASVDVITGADHFFGAGTEFELYDKILAALASK